MMMMMKTSIINVTTVPINEAMLMISIAVAITITNIIIVAVAIVLNSLA